ncbi:AP-1-like transcription factor YAP1 [Saccharomyces cerevisiae]|nr:AP-1-like transcription factor YAP1 [Saccharomyces cerevisiae]
MSVSAAKRSLDVVSPGSLAEFEGSESRHDEIENEHRRTGTRDGEDSEQPKKKGSKTSRKQDLDPETKQKRTAQNRAAQRAFRERKERKMKELEKKVQSLESIQQQNEVEATFLRDQLITLVNELKKYRPETRNDSKVLEYLARRDPNLHFSKNNVNHSNSEPIDTPNDDIQENVKQKMNFTFQYPLDNDNDNDYSKNVGKQLPSPNDPSHSAPMPINQTQKKLSDATDSSSATLDSLSNSNDVLNNTPNSSTSMDWLDNVIYTNRFVSGDDGSNSKTKNLDSNMFSNDFNFENQFDEQVSEFCSKMNQVCGTRQCPIPKKPISALDKEVFASSSILSSNSPALTNTWESHSNITDNTPANVIATDATKYENSFSGFGRLGFDMSANHYVVNDNSTGSTDSTGSTGNKNKKNNNNSDDVLPFISESPFDMNQVTNFFSPGSTGIGNNAASNTNPSLLQSSKEDIPFINANLAFPDDNSTNIQLQPFSESQSQNKFDYDMFFRDSSKEGNNLFGEFLEDDDDDKKAANMSDDESSLIKNQLINEEPELPKQYLQSLMAKAKCSERGVVINAEDVQLALNKHMN